MKVVVVGGGISGLSAARRLEASTPDVDVVLLERSKLGGKILTKRVDGFLIEGSADSFLSRKERGIALCKELGLDGELIGRRPENARSYVRRGDQLHPLPGGLTGMIPTDVDRLRESPLLSADGRERLAGELDIPPAPAGGDESIASFVSRRLGREAYENLVEPLMTGIYGGDGEQLSLQATFPNLRALEIEHGSVLRGLASQAPGEPGRPPFVSLRGGMDSLITTLGRSLDRTTIHGRARGTSVRRLSGRYVVDGTFGQIQADAVVIATPAFVTAQLLAGLDPELAGLHEEIPYASSSVVSLAYRREDVPHDLDGYGYVVPRAQKSDVLACTWSSSKWEERAPAGFVLLRVYVGHDASRLSTDRLGALARDELRVLAIDPLLEPVLSRVDRWPRGMPQYVLGHPERLERIEAALERHPGLALAGAAYRGVGIPDCIHSGEQAARAVAESLAITR